MPGKCQLTLDAVSVTSILHTQLEISLTCAHLVLLACSGRLALPSHQPTINGMGREILKELVETDTTHSAGSTTVAAERMAARLLAAGFPKA